MQQTDELFSALLDGELASDDIDAVIEALDKDPDTTDAVTRWGCIGAVMRGQTRVSARPDLLEGVRQAIATEAAEASDKVVPMQPHRSAGKRRWALPATGLAAAASLAIAAFVVPVAMQQDGATGPAGQDTPLLTSSGAIAMERSVDSSGGDAVGATSTARVQRDNRDAASAWPAGDERLNTYYIEYAGHRSAQGIGGPLGYARYAAHNADLSHRTR